MLSVDEPHGPDARFMLCAVEGTKPIRRSNMLRRWWHVLPNGIMRRPLQWIVDLG